MRWIQFQAEPPRLDLLDQIPSKTFNIIWINIVVGSHFQQNPQPYMIQHNRWIKFPANLNRYVHQHICWIEFQAKPLTLYESAYLLYQIPSRSFDLIRIDISVGSNSKQNLEQYTNQHICWIELPAKPTGFSYVQRIHVRGTSPLRTGKLGSELPWKLCWNTVYIHNFQNTFENTYKNTLRDNNVLLQCTLHQHALVTLHSPWICTGSH